MDKRLLVLKRFLEALGMDTTIVSLSARKALQKAVYLGQAVGGVDLGYRYGWYVRGPYSPSLAEDYYALAEEEGLQDPGQTPPQLAAPVKERLHGVAPLLQVPSQLDGKLRQPEWLELLASWHYLREVAKYDEGKAMETLAREKPHLVDYVDHAKGRLSERAERAA